MKKVDVARKLDLHLGDVNLVLESVSLLLVACKKMRTGHWR
jgi:hypothetical protein